MPRQIQRFRDRRGSAIASAIMGGLILLFLAVIIFLVPEPNEFQRAVLRFFIAVSAAALAYFFVGGVILQGALAGLQVGGGGGFVLFILIQFVFDPLKIQTVVADSAPALVPPSNEIAQAQQALTRLGVYRGAADGVAGAATRNAIKNFQRREDLPTTGYLDPSTQKAFKDAEAQSSKFEGQPVAATNEERSVTQEIVAKNRLKTPVALTVVFDSVVNAGGLSTWRYADQATASLGGSPATGVSERAWLLAFLEARTEHLHKLLPQFASQEDKFRLAPLRAQIHALPQ